MSMLFGLRNRIYAMVSRILRDRGIECIPSWRVRQLGLALHLRDIFARHKVDLVLDVGANEGQYGEFLRTMVGFRGWIVSVEPATAAANALAERAKRDVRWRFEVIALGSAEGEGQLNVMRDSQFSSFLAPDNSLVGAYAAQNQVERVERVPIRTLDGEYDRLVRDTGCSRPYLKIDTQGFDLDVIRGAGETLHRFVAMQTEASVRPLYKEMPSWLSVLSELEGRGLSLSGMFPISTDGACRLLEFDCVLVNSSWIE